jgi:hypothetical protein
MADVPAPVETNRGPRVKTKSGGIGSFIPPELKETGRQAANLASALDPVQGILRGMSASGRAADTELSPEERRAALIEAGIETAAPLAMMGLGALAKQPVKATVLDILTPTGAPQAVVDDVADPSRRAFMKGAVATGGIAAIAPDVITEALEKVPAAVKRVRGGGHMATVLDSISKNKEKASELYDKTRDLSKKINPYLESIRKTNLPIKTTPEEIQESFEAMGQTRELQKEAGRLESMNDANLTNLLQSIQNSPKILDDAQDADLDEFIAQLDSLPFGYGERLEDPEFSVLYDEIKKRGLHQQKTKDGLDEYPYARMFVEDYEEGILEINPTTTPSSFDMKITDRDTIPVEDLVGRDQEDRAREMIREALVKEFELGQEKGLSSEQIDTNIAIKRRTLEKEYGIDFSKADGGEMRKGVGSLSETARRMNEGGEANINYSLGDIEYRADLEPHMDPLAEMGFDVNKIDYDMMYDRSNNRSEGSHFNPNNDRILISPGDYSSKGVAAHEMRHRGLERLFRIVEQGYPAAKKLGLSKEDYLKILRLYKLDQQQDRQRRVNDPDFEYSGYAHEKIAEGFEKDETINRGAQYFLSNPNAPLFTFDREERRPRTPAERLLLMQDALRENAMSGEQAFGPDLSIKKFTPSPTSMEAFRETEGRAEIERYLNEGPQNTPENISEFAEQALAAQRYADMINERNKTIRRNTSEYAMGGEVSGPPPDRGPTPQGIGSLSETARRMNEGGEAVSEYRKALIQSESSGRVGALNPDTGAVGLTQGMSDTVDQFRKETNRDFTAEEYAQSRDLQTAFQDWYEQTTLNYIAENDLDQYLGDTIKGVPITVSSMMAMAHLGGNYGMKKFLETEGRYDPDDKKGEEVGTRLSDYGRKFAGLNPYTEESFPPMNVSDEEIVMSMPVEQEAQYTDPRTYNRPLARPPVTYDGPRPMQRPMMPQDAPQQEMIKQAVQEVVQPQSLQQKYSPQGIEQMLTGTIGEPLLPRQFQQGSPYSSMQ